MALRVSRGVLALLREQNKANHRRVYTPFSSVVGPMHITNVTSAKMRGWVWDSAGGYYCDEYGPVADRTGREFNADELRKIEAYNAVKGNKKGAK